MQCPSLGDCIIICGIFIQWNTVLQKERNSSVYMKFKNRQSYSNRSQDSNNWGQGWVYWHGRTSGMLEVFQTLIEVAINCTNVNVSKNSAKGGCLKFVHFLSTSIFKKCCILHLHWNKGNAVKILSSFQKVFSFQNSRLSRLLLSVFHSWQIASLPNGLPTSSSSSQTGHSAEHMIFLIFS